MEIVKGRVQWIDIGKPSEKDCGWLQETFHIHPLIINELKGPSLRDKVEAHKNYLYLIYYFPIYDVKERVSRRAEIDFENGLLEALLKENSFEVPKRVVERRLVSLTESAAESLHRRRMGREAIEKELKAIYEKLRPEAERQVRLSFLLEAIAKKENLQLADSDFQAKYKETALRHRQSPEAVEKYYSEHPEAKESLGIQILNEKAVQWIKDNAQTGKSH